MHEGIVSAESDLKVEGYDILHPIGSGGMGQVYLARQLPLGRLVALKILSLDQAGNTQERITRFRREAELMANLSHPNVLPVFQYGETHNRPYLVLEYIAEGDLRRLMPEGKPMPANSVMAILGPVADALAYLHSRGILHRDLKPENILMHEGKVPKVADFGVAVSLLGTGGLTKTGNRIGTLGYVAPEQHYQLDVDERADQYSLAALSYEMLTGQRPLGILKPPSMHNPKLSPAVDEVIFRGLQESPRERFRSVLEYVMALNSSLIEPVPPVANPKPWWLPAAMIGGPLAITGPLIILGLWFMRPPGPPPGDHGFPPVWDRGKADVPKIEPVKPPQKTQEEKAAEEQHNKVVHELIARKSREIWELHGSPKLPDDKSTEIWLEAEKAINDAIEKRAFELYVEKGSPSGEEGEAMRLPNQYQAARELLQKAKSSDPPAKPADAKSKDKP